MSVKIMKVIAKEFFQPPVTLPLLGLNIFPIALLRSKLYIRPFPYVTAQA